MMNAAIYARTASSERSLNSQVQICREYIQELGGSVAAIYEDLGVNGLNLDRLAMTEMLTAGSSGKFDTLVLTGIDRISRNRADVMKFISDLELLKISLIIIKDSTNEFEGFDNDEN
ncbi:recombinase family protein [Paenibacillus mesotrionivorans]|uniref:Recombinase family protein n=1 Tax=Paenibacillus mesotrionivorans TaxID=3160968 RepID=A0ACC7NX89_9BACL